MLKIKILLVAPISRNLGGISNWANKIVTYYKEHDLVELSTLDTSLRGREFTDSRLYKRIIAGSIQAVTDYLRFIMISLRTKPEVVHLCTSGSFAFYKDYLICSFCKLIGMKSIVHLHFGRIEEIKDLNNWEWKIASKVFGKVDCIMTIDSKTYNSINNTKYHKKIINISNPIERIDMPDGKIDNGMFNVIFVGSIIDTKGINELLYSASRLKDKNVFFHIVGKANDAMLEKIDSFIKKENLGSSIHLYGHLPNKDVIELVNKADLFVLPSYTEGFPNCILEAMMLGKPIISTTVGAIPDMLDINTTTPCGVCVAPRDADGLLNALNKLINDEGLRNILAKRAREKALSEYEISNVIRQYITCYEYLLKEL